MLQRKGWRYGVGNELTVQAFNDVNYVTYRILVIDPANQRAWVRVIASTFVPVAFHDWISFGELGCEWDDSPPRKQLDLISDGQVKIKKLKKHKKVVA